MKILYAVQATGNGHISRAMQLLPYLNNYGTVDILLSGSNSHLSLNAPVKYRSKGLSLFFNCKGGLNYPKLLTGIDWRAIKKDIKELPVEQYDVILNDFDYVTARACQQKNITSIQFGHQASFMSAKTPRPAEKSRIGEYVLKNYAPATHYVGLHFKPYDSFIFPPVIKKELLDAEPTNKGHITVYLPGWCEPELTALFTQLPDFNFEIFSKDCKQAYKVKNIAFFPVDYNSFNTSFLSCNGIITGGGFETPAEALHLGKKIIAVPIKGHYEQLCNAAALNELNGTRLTDFQKNLYPVFEQWLYNAPTINIRYNNAISQCLEYIFGKIVKA